MNGRKLEKMLCERPGVGDYSKYIILGCLGIGAFMLVFFAIIGILSVEGLIFTAALTVAIIIFTYIIMAIFLSVRFSRITPAGRRLKENGQKSIRFLKAKGLLDAAAAEYAGDDKIVCKATHRDGRMNRFVSRKNALTPNFIFIMSENAILPYSAVTEVTFDKYHYTQHSGDNDLDINASVTHTNDVLTVKSVDNCEYDLLNINNGVLTQKRYETIVGIINRIKEKNPSCKVPEISTIAASIEN